MISVSKLIQQIRIDTKDINEVKYSNWDILNAMNKALRYLSNYLATTNADFMDGSITYTHNEVINGAVFPEDFLTIVSVLNLHGHKMSPTTIVRHNRNEYTVSNGRLYALEPVVLRYKRSMGEAVEGGMLDIPQFAFDMVATSTELLLDGQGENTLTQYITENAKSIIPPRKYAGAKLKMPFKV